MAPALRCTTSRIGKACAAAMAACAALVASPGEARADHEQAGTVALFGLILAHGQLVPAYLSTGYYAYASDERMPVAWTVMNVITGTAAGSVGVAMMSIALDYGETDHFRSENNTQVLLGFYGGVTLAAGLAVSVISIVQATRDPSAPKRGPAKEKAIRVLPTAGVTETGAPQAVSWSPARFSQLGGPCSLSYRGATAARVPL